jgi:hypothetical protein
MRPMPHAEVDEANEACLRNKPTVRKLWLQAKFPSTVLDVGCGGAASDREAGEFGDRTGQMRSARDGSCMRISLLSRVAL